MALIQCPRCGKTISTNSSQCVHCNLPKEQFIVAKPNAKAEPVVNVSPTAKKPFYRHWLTWVITFALIVGAVVLLKLGGDKGEEKVAAEEVTLPISGTHEGYDYVDLGLPSGLKWATCNVGADTPKESGDHYAWGETSVQINIAQDSCATYKKNIGDIGGTDRDVAHVKWGGDWRMPTKDEFEELRNECDWTWTTHNGKKGYMVTGCNGNSIFLPADASCSYNGKPYGSCGKYWTSTPGLSNHHQSAYNFNIESDNIDLGCPVRWVGFLIRPVFSENCNYDDSNDSQANEALAEAVCDTKSTLHGHDYVDLGLSVKWATMNVGADSPADVGVHYAWGGVDPMVTWVDEEFQPYKDVYFGENDANRVVIFKTK